MMYGHTELPEHWVRHLLLLRDIQKETRGFTEFVPLGFIHSQTKLFQSGGARAGRSVHEDLIVHALARVLLHGYIPNIQVSWVKLGFEQSLACLEAGANDFGGTLMEESISKAAGANFGEYVSPGEFRALIRTIGRIPAERATTYKIRKVFEHPDAEERLPLEPNAKYSRRQRTTLRRAQPATKAYCELFRWLNDGVTCPVCPWRRGLVAPNQIRETPRDRRGS